MTVEISVGQFANNAMTHTVTAPTLLEALTTIKWNDGWWVGSVFEPPVRRIEHWKRAITAVIDVDYHDGEGKKAVPPEEWYDAIEALLRVTPIASNYYRTPHGFRLAWELARVVEDRELYERVLAGARVLARTLLSEAGVLATGHIGHRHTSGFAVDVGASKQVAQFMWAATTTVSGVPRSAEVLDLGTTPWDAEGLAELAVEDQDYSAQAAAGGDPLDADQLADVLAKMEHLGEHDGSLALMRVANKAVGLGVETRERFVEVAQKWNSKRGEQRWSDEDLARRFDDALRRHEASGRAAVPMGKYTVAALQKIVQEDRGYKGLLCYDVIEQNDRLNGCLLLDHERTAIRVDICRRYGYPHFPVRDLDAALRLEARRTREYDAVSDYLGSLVWDGVPRMAEFTRRMRALSPAPELVEKYLRKTLIAAVARRAQPGCKHDHVLTLIGLDRAGKSRVFKALAGEAHFNDTPIDIASKDGYMQLSRAWIHEWAEVDATTRKADVARLRAFMSSGGDLYRSPFERIVEWHPRRSICVATTNAYAFLSDPDTTRRWWAIEVARGIDVAWVEEHRDQLWAEAVEAYASGEPWYLDEADEHGREEANEIYRLDDPLVEFVRAVVLRIEADAAFTGWFASDRLYTLLGYQGDVDRQTRDGVSRALRALGYGRRRGRLADGAMRWGWQRM